MRLNFMVSIQQGYFDNVYLVVLIYLSITSIQLGQTPKTLLSFFYRENEDKFVDYFKFSLDHLGECPYLLDLVSLRIAEYSMNLAFNIFSWGICLILQLLFILPNCRSPFNAMNKVKPHMMTKLKSFELVKEGLDPKEAFDRHSVQLVGALVNIAAAVKLSADAHLLEAKELHQIQLSVELALCECMASPCMNNPDNVTRVLRRQFVIDPSVPSIVSKALAVKYGPLHTCVVHCVKVL